MRIHKNTPASKGEPLAQLSVLFVCTGNICRSPTAVAVLQSMLKERGYQDKVRVDGAGTTVYHEGEAPDPRSSRYALQRGYDMSHLRARKVEKQDFATYHWIIALASEHLAWLIAHCPANSRAQCVLLKSFVHGREHESVLDPYYGGERDFLQVLDDIEEACRLFLDKQISTALAVKTA